MRAAWMVVWLGLLMLAFCGSASVPSDAKPIELDQTITDYAPGYYYKVDVPAPGTLEVILEDVPADMETRIIVINEADSWLADEQDHHSRTKGHRRSKMRMLLVRTTLGLWICME